MAKLSGLEKRQLDGSIGGRLDPELPITLYGHEIERNEQNEITYWCFPDLKYAKFRTVKWGKTRKGDVKKYITNRKGERQYQTYGEVLRKFLALSLRNGHERCILKDALGRECLAYVVHPGFENTTEQSVELLVKEG